MVVTVTDGGSVQGECTLEDAVRAANINPTVEGCASCSEGIDAIGFAAGVSGTIFTADVLLLAAAEPLTIMGPGARLLAIDGGRFATPQSARVILELGAEAHLGGCSRTPILG
ncbi:MAG: hypothetical protein ACI80V_000064 [Rhodothermales bacterium]|jgi:hypothetical protein